MRGETMYQTEKRMKEYSYNDDSGDAQAVVYQLFPGVEVAYISVHMADFDFGLFEQGAGKNYVTIHYCAEGHKGAAGLVIDTDKLEIFKHAINNSCFLQDLYDFSGNDSWRYRFWEKSRMGM